MTTKERANELVDKYRIILMNQDTQCGEEILCTGIAKRCALICIDEMLDIRNGLYINESFVNTIQRL